MGAKPPIHIQAEFFLGTQKGWQQKDLLCPDGYGLL